MQSELKLAGTLAGVGVVVALAKMLASTEPLTWRVVVGRAILSGVLGLAAGAIVIFVPEITFIGQVSVACILTSMGSSALEPLLNRLTSK